MNPARLIVLVVALVTAAASAYLVRNMMSSDGPAEAAQQVAFKMPTSRVLVASRPIEIGETISAADLRWQAWPDDALAAAFIVEVEGQTSIADRVGAIVRAPITEGEPVLDSKLVKRDNDGGFMSAILTPGMRAVGIPISEESSAGGFILPNDRVDVILTRKYKINDGRVSREAYESDTIITNVRVLAIGQNLKEEGDQKVVLGQTATLELTTHQVEAVTLAQIKGTLSLSLRSLGRRAGNNPWRDEGKDTEEVILKTEVLRDGRKSARGAGQ